MLIGSGQRLKKFGSLALSIDDHLLGRESIYRYLGVIMNEALSWADHIDYIRSKEAKRLGVLKRIKHLLPLHARISVVNSLIMPLLDYGDLVCGGRNNVSLMNGLQLLHNKLAKTVLDLSYRASSIQVLASLHWHPLSHRRQFHRSCFVYKMRNNMVNSSVEEIRGTDTRTKSLLKLPLCRANWGQQTSEYIFFKEWNTLPISIKESNSFIAFKSNYVNTPYILLCPI